MECPMMAVGSGGKALSFVVGFEGDAPDESPKTC